MKIQRWMKAKKKKGISYFIYVQSGPRKSPKLDKKKLKKRKGRQGKVEKEDPLDDIE